MSKNSPIAWPAPSEQRADQLRNFLDRFGLSADRLLLFDQALTHASYAFEHSRPGDNERLEFLGDTVIGAVTAEWLYHTFPDAGEGKLSKMKATLVSRSVLGQRAQALALGDVLLLGRGDSRARRRSSMLGSALEALAAAVLVECGPEAARAFILDHIVVPGRGFLEDAEMRDFKSALQELVQKRFHETPDYTIVSEQGPDHEKQFRVEVSIQGTVYGSGEGKRRKAAENQAASAALERLRGELQA